VGSGARGGHHFSVVLRLERDEPDSGLTWPPRVVGQTGDVWETCPHVCHWSVERWEARLYSKYVITNEKLHKSGT
jgi:hypothetical protein